MREPVAAAWLAVLVALVAAGSAFTTPWLPLQEAGVVQGARDLGAAPARAGWLYELLLAVPSRTLSAGAVLLVAKAVAAVSWAAIVLPAYVLARRAALQRPAALVAAALALVSCGAVYATAALPDTLALVLGTGAVAAVAAERPLAAQALAIAAAVARPWFLPLPFALAWAASRPESRSALVRWPGAAALPIAVASLYGAYLASGATSVGGVVRAGAASLGLAALAAGILPFTLAWGASDGIVRSLLAPVTAAAAVGAGFAGASNEVRAEERASFVLVPLVLALATAAVSRGIARPPALVAAGGVAICVAVLQWPVPRAAGGALAVSLWRDIGSHAVVVAVAAAIAVLPVLPLRRRRYVALPAGALLVGSTVAALVGAVHESRALRQGVPLPKSQVDDAVGRGAQVTWALTGNADPRAVAEAELFNRSLRKVVRVDPARVDPDTGVVAARRTEYVLGSIPLAGRKVAEIPLGTIRRVGGPVRAAELVDGVYPDGWSGFQTTYTRYAGTGEAVLVITISRETWTGPDKPAQVSADAAPIGGQPFAERVTTIHAREVTKLRVPVPPPPFQVIVRVSPTFSAAELGAGSDTRQLGAVLTFAYVTR